MPTPARSLADDLRGRSDPELSALLVRRPDLARPAPADLTTLAARATTRASAQRALDGLDTALLHTLEAAQVADLGTPAVIARLLGEPPASRTVRDLLERLWGLALVWRAGEAYRVPRAVAEVLAEPAGLGPVIPGVPEGELLTLALSRTDPPARAVLDALTWGPATGALPESNGTGDGVVGGATRELVSQGLLHRVDPSHVVLPRQVALALRQGRLHRDPALHPPVGSGVHVDLAGVDAVVGGRAGELLALGAEVLDAWTAVPPQVLRAGGLAARDLSRLAAHLEVGVPEAAWLLEVLLSAGLVGRDDTSEASWVPTEAVDGWSASSPGRRWADLAGAWLGSAAAPSLVGSSAAGRVNVLGPATSWPAGRTRRRDALAALTTLPPGLAPGEDELLTTVRWHHPVRYARADAAGVAAGLDVVLREAEWAGMLGRGALSTPGRALLAGDRTGAATSMAAHVPAAIDHVLLQADLSAIAPGRLDGHVRSVVRLLADVESRGGATVHRIGEQSLRRALDIGWTAEQILGELAGISSTGVPQPLDYLVRDVARRHGVARVGTCAAYLRSDDEALLDQVGADRALALLQLRRIAPTVLVTAVPAATVLDLLREHRYGPVAEGSDGGVSLTPRRRHRTSRPPEPAVRVGSVDQDTADGVVAALRHGESARDAHPDGDPPPGTEPVLTASLLREAAAEGVAVWVGYVDDVGGARRHLLRPHQVEAGRVRGTLGDNDAPRTLLLHRITGVRPAV